PASGPMPDKFDELLQKPPPGVQVWSACVAGQQSYETDDAPAGVFLDGLRKTLVAPPRGMKGAFEGTIQKHDDLIDLPRLNKAVNAVMKGELGRRKLTQLARVAGSAPAKGAAFDPDEKAPPPPVLPAPAEGDPAAVRKILAELAVPPLHGGKAH